MTKIAVTYKDNEVFQHFGHSEQFKVYETDGDKIVNSKVLDTEGQGHGALSELLSNNGIDVLICGGIGQGAREALKNAGIKLYPGVTGNADSAVQNLLTGTLDYNENTVCAHHHEDGHDCASHHAHCGEDKHGCRGNG